MGEVKINLGNPQLWEILKDLDVRNAVFVSPTDTVYGLGTRFENYDGMQRLLQLKERENTQFLVLARDLEQVHQLAKLSAVQEIIVKRYWPGPITFVLEAKRPEGATIAVRIPKSDFLHRLMSLLDAPFISTSCNKKGQPPVTEVEQAVALFKDSVDIYLDGGKQQNEGVSTLVDLTGKTPKVLREGLVKFP